LQEEQMMNIKRKIAQQKMEERIKELQKIKQFKIRQEQIMKSQ